MSEKPFEFQVGDIVEFGGLEGCIAGIERLPTDRPLSIQFPDFTRNFTIDGRIDPRHTKPLLNLVSRPKKKITKTIERWVNVFPRYISNLVYEELTDANVTGPDRIACVKLTGTYECEE